MKKLALSLPVIADCDVTECGYNSGADCHAARHLLPLMDSTGDRETAAVPPTRWLSTGLFLDLD